MISRPLDLSSKLSRPRAGLDWLFFVNVGLIALFFTLFGSRFVLSPGLGSDFRLPMVEAGVAAVTPTSSVISVQRGGIIFAEPGGNLSMEQLRVWLRAAARENREPRLLVRASADVSLGDLALIKAAAEEAGFVGIVWGAELNRAAKSAGDKP